MIQLLLVQRTRMKCELLASALEGEADIHIVGYAHNCEEVSSNIRKATCNTIVIDVELLNNGLWDCIRKLRQSNGDIKVLISGIIESNVAILRYIEEGFHGYILENDSVATMVHKLRGVHEDEFIVSPSMASALIARVSELKEWLRNMRGPDSNLTANLLAELTPREWEVLGLIEQGFDNQEIANRLVIEKGTVKNHVHNILGKLDIRCRKQAAFLARQLRVESETDKTMGKVNAIPAFYLPEPSVSRKQVN